MYAKLYLPNNEGNIYELYVGNILPICNTHGFFFILYSFFPVLIHSRPVQKVFYNFAIQFSSHKFFFFDWAICEKSDKIALFYATLVSSYF